MPYAARADCASTTGRCYSFDLASWAAASTSGVAAQTRSPRKGSDTPIKTKVTATAIGDMIRSN